MSEVTYQVEYSLDVFEFIDVLKRSTLAERRPVGDIERMKKMCDHANLIVTARDHGKLIGVSRSLTDFSFCTYLSDLAVDVDYQHQGIGKKLIEITKLQAPLAKLILLAAPAAIDYYPKIGMKRYKYCFLLD